MIEDEKRLDMMRMDGIEADWSILKYFEVFWNILNRIEFM